MGLMQADEATETLPKELNTFVERFKIDNLPSFTKVVYQGEDWTAFKSKVDEAIAADILGSKNVKARLNDLEYHADLVNRNWERLKFSVDRINGLKPTRPVSMKSTAQLFYESLNTPMLRQQCTLFGLDYNSYETQEEVIATLVVKHMEMVEAA